MRNTYRTPGATHADYTYCAKYGNAPECGGVPPPAPVAAAAPGRLRGRAQRSPQWSSRIGAPPNKPGECYTKVFVPAQFRDEPVQQLVRPAGERSEYTEPVYEEVEERVMVKPAWKKITVVPAEYGQVEEKVLVREAYKREIEIPALYNTYFEKTLEKPARQVWKPGRGTVEKVDPNTGEILCLVEEEAVYKTVERKELARPASKTYQDVPAEYATVTKTVVTKPESVQEVEVPAVYETRKVTKLVKAPEQKKVAVAAEYATVNKQVMVSPEKAEWVQVLCDRERHPGKDREGRECAQGPGLSGPAHGGRQGRSAADRIRQVVPVEERLATQRFADGRHAREARRRVAVTAGLHASARTVHWLIQHPPLAGAFFPRVLEPRSELPAPTPQSRRPVHARLPPSPRLTGVAPMRRTPPASRHSASSVRRLARRHDGVRLLRMRPPSGFRRLAHDSLNSTDAGWTKVDVPEHSSDTAQASGGARIHASPRRAHSDYAEELMSESNKPGQAAERLLELRAVARRGRG